MTTLRQSLIAVCVLVFAASSSFAAAPYVFDGTDGLLDWGLTIDTTSGFYGDGTDGTRLVWKETAGGTELAQGLVTGVKAGIVGKIEDYVQSDDISSPGDPLPSWPDDVGEAFDVEAIFKTSDGAGFHLLIILSTPEDIFSYSGTEYMVGDLAINTNYDPGGATVPFSAELGIKLAGDSKGDIRTGASWGSFVNPDAGKKAHRDPNPAFPDGSSTWGAGNFYHDSGASVGTAGVTWKEIITGSDDPDQNSSWPANNTYAIQVSFNPELLGESVKDIWLAPSCVNDRFHMEAPGLPPTVLLAILPALGMVARRFRRH